MAGAGGGGADATGGAVLSAVSTPIVMPSPVATTAKTASAGINRRAFIDPPSAPLGPR
jgi:hypothetical protein